MTPNDESEPHTATHWQDPPGSMVPEPKATLWVGDPPEHAVLVAVADDDETALDVPPVMGLLAPAPNLAMAAAWNWACVLSAVGLMDMAMPLPQ